MLDDQKCRERSTLAVEILRPSTGLDQLVKLDSVSIVRFRNRAFQSLFLDLIDTGFGMFFFQDGDVLASQGLVITEHARILSRKLSVAAFGGARRGSVSIIIFTNQGSDCPVMACGPSPKCSVTMHVALALVSV